MKLSREYLQHCLDAGMNVDLLAAACGVSRGAVFAALRQHGLQPRSGAKRKLPPTPELIARIKKGEHPESIGEAFGVSASAVHGALGRAGTSVKQILNRRGAMGFPASVFRTSGDIDLGDRK